MEEATLASILSGPGTEWRLPSSPSPADRERQTSRLSRDPEAPEAAQELQLHKKHGTTRLILDEKESPIPWWDRWLPNDEQRDPATLGPEPNWGDSFDEYKPEPRNLSTTTTQWPGRTLFRGVPFR